MTLDQQHHAVVRLLQEQYFHGLHPTRIYAHEPTLICNSIALGNSTTTASSEPDVAQRVSIAS